MRQVYAIAACFGLFIIYTIICGILGWKNGGGAIPTILFFTAVIWTWKAIANEDKKIFRNKSKITDEELAGIIAGNSFNSYSLIKARNSILFIDEVFELGDHEIQSYIKTLSSRELDDLEQKIIKLSFSEDYYYLRYLEILPEGREDAFHEAYNEAFENWNKENDPIVKFGSLEVDWDWDFKPPNFNQAQHRDPESTREHLSNIVNLYGDVECLQCGYKGQFTIEPPENPRLICAECGSDRWKPLTSPVP